MANLFAIHSVGASLVTYLRNSYPESLRHDQPCDFRLLSAGELIKTDDLGTTLSLFLHRVTINEHLRNTMRTSDAGRNLPLTIDLHYLLTVWANAALAEQAILAWAMRQLYLHPVLDASSLSPEAGWTSDDIVQVMPTDMPTEEMMRIWDALDPPYRLSVAYVMRVVRIDADPITDGRPVVATRTTWTDREAGA